MRHFATEDLEGIAAALDAEELRATDLAEAAIAAHDRHGAYLDAYVHFDAAGMRSAAAAADAAFAAGRRVGAFQGIPVSVKDLFGLTGMPTFAGSPRRLPARFETDGPLIAAQRSQLAVFTGKTRMVEFALGGTGINPHWSVPRNPWDSTCHRSPGGSSSGAGVSLAEGSALIAWGSDTMGSVRMPASVTGCVGLKLTAGRWPTGGIVPLSHVFDSPGLLTRSVADAAYAFGALDPAAGGAGAFLRKARHRGLAGLRLGIGNASQWEDCDPGIAETAMAALQELEAAGAVLADQPMPEAAEALAIFREGPTPPVELRAFLDHELPGWLDTLDPYIRPLVAGADRLGASVFQGRLLRLARAAGTARAAFDTVDLMVCPTVPVTAPPMATIVDMPSHWRASDGLIRNTCPVNLLGLCALSMPVGLDAEGMPVGLQFTAPAGAEELLLSAALAAERVLGRPLGRIGRPPLPQA
jgi:aspartyl-tRNA(Asn)/glutamyl-tRNA(Gln) amidotransferase subunit A